MPSLLSQGFRDVAVRTIERGVLPIRGYTLNGSFLFRSVDNSLALVASLHHLRDALATSARRVVFTAKSHDFLRVLNH